MAIASTVQDIGRAVRVQASSRAHGWLDYLVKRRVKRSLAKAWAKREAGAYADVAPETRARSIVRWACAKTAVTGALSGAVTTAAIVATVETEGLAGIVAIPLAALAIGGEMAARTIIHIDLACELAVIFEVRVDSDDVVRLLALAVRGEVDAVRDELGQGMVKSATIDRAALFDNTAQFLVGETVLRNLVPFLNIVVSAFTNVVVTRRLGQRLVRSFRYERAMLDALRDAAGPCASSMDALAEGLWFVFVADGRLAPEQTACLAQRIDDMDERRGRQLLGRLTFDDSGWIDRVAAVPEGARDSFLRVLEVAAALDEAVPSPGEKVLRRCSDAFHRTYDPEHLRRTVEELQRTGAPE